MKTTAKATLAHVYAVDAVLTVVVQYQLVKVAATRFLPDVLMHHVAAQLVQSDAIRQWLTALTTECS
jgi:hypothetical protein